MSGERVEVEGSGAILHVEGDDGELHVMSTETIESSDVDEHGRIILDESHICPKCYSRTEAQT